MLSPVSPLINPLDAPTEDADNHGVNKTWLPLTAVAAVLALAGTARSMGHGAPMGTMELTAGGSTAVVIASGATVALRRRKGGTFPDGGLVRAIRAWDAGESSAIETWLSDLVGRMEAEHAARTAKLCLLMGEQLAVQPESIDALTLAGLAHVSPGAFEIGRAGCGAFSLEAISHSSLAVHRAGHPEAAETIAQAGEHWDGSGAPHGLLGEAISLQGRILGTACAFDRAAALGLDAGLRTVREGTGTMFDPVVAAELLHLFREPWQSRQAA